MTTIRDVLLSIGAPPEIAAAFDGARRGADGWFRGRCPLCDPPGCGRKNLCAHEAYGPEKQPFWKCHRCGERRWRQPGSGASHSARSDADHRRRQAQGRREADERFDRAHVLRRGDPVVRYFGGRQLEVVGPTWPTSLRFAMLLYGPELNAAKEAGRSLRTVEPRPALVARIDDVSGRLLALHITFVTAAGEKANLPEGDKRYKGSPSGGAVRLEPIRADDSCVTLCEGVETGLAIMMLRNDPDAPFRGPVLACTSTSCLRSVRLPRHVRNVVIAADNDPPDSRGRRPGVNAAFAAAERFATKERRQVEIFTTRGVNDANDLLLYRRRGGG